MKILALSGSLRKNSYNTSIIKFLASLSTDVEIYDGISQLPFFNPDIDNSTLENDTSPVAVQEFRKAVSEADAIIISTPEYAFEIPGVLKNALDWLVSSADIIDKNVVIISASTSDMGGDKANSVLCGLVKVLTGNIVNTTLIVGRVNKKIDTVGQINDKKLINDLKNLLDRLTKNYNRA